MTGSPNLPRGWCWLSEIQEEVEVLVEYDPEHGTIDIYGGGYDKDSPYWLYAHDVMEDAKFIDWIRHLCTTKSWFTVGHVRQFIDVALNVREGARRR